MLLYITEYLTKNLQEQIVILVLGIMFGIRYRKFLINTINMNKKINNLKEIDYYSNFNLVGEYIIKWKKMKEDSKPLNEMYFAWQDIGFYVHNMIIEQRHYDTSISEYRADKNRAIIRARDAEEKLEKLEKEMQKYKKIYG